MGCVGIKRTEDAPITEWKGINGAVFAKYLTCMGLVQREVDEQRLNECPCLMVTTEKPTIVELTASIEKIIHMVSQNKLAELLQMLAAEMTGSSKYDSVQGNGNGGSNRLSFYDQNAEFRARLLALREWLRRMYGYETFDVGFRELPFATDGDWFVMNGPVYIFLQSSATGGVARVVFPSMTKTGSQFLNYDNLAKAHRWVERFINNVVYTTTISGCNMQCLNFPTSMSSYKYNWRMARCVRQRYYMPCGRTDVKTGDAKDPKLAHSVIYEVNLNYPSISTAFAKSRIRAPVYSILPTDWDMYAGTRHMLISENRKWFMVLKGDTLGIYENRNNADLVAMTRTEPGSLSGVYKYGIKFAGQASRLSLEAGVLTIYGRPNPSFDDDNEMLWRVELAKEGIAPMALYLHDDGQLSLFDGNNKNVLDMASWNALLDRTEREVVLSGYDPNEEYKQRFLQLLDWLRTRNLLQTFLPNAAAIDFKAIDFEDMAPDAPFDSTIHYRKRFMDLMAVLQIKYPNITLPSDVEVQNAFKVDVATTPKAPYDASAVREERLKDLASL